MNLTRHSRIITAILLLMIIVAYATTPAVGRELKAGVIELKDNRVKSQSILSNQQAAATVTIIINLPIIEQNAPTTTPVPLNVDSPAESETELNTGTPTPTPIPAQTGSVNIPIVFGALAIILVIILAWFFVGYLPAKNKE